MTASPRVVIGADTHLDTNHLAVITDAGKPLADAEFPTNPAGYDDAVRWAQSFGTIVIAGVEGTSSYGAGLTRVLQAAQIEVAEVSRPDRAARRRRGKSDPLDAYTAARAALAGDRLAVPKDEHTSAVRALLSARRSAVKAHTAATNQIHALLVTAPAELRERYRRHSITALVKALARCRPATHSDPTTVAVLTSAKALAQRVEFLSVNNTTSPHNWTSLSGRSIPRYGPPTVSVPTPPPNCWSPPAPTRTGYATRPPSPHCAGRPPSRHPRAKSPATDSPVAVTAQPTTPCIASRWCACRPTHKRATTSSAKTPTAAPKKRFCGYSNEPSSAKSSDC